MIVGVIPVLNLMQRFLIQMTCIEQPQNAVYDRKRAIAGLANKRASDDGIAM
jgi:hypothetical protein